MPQDFRLAYLKQLWERSEKKKQAEVDNLMASGGSIHDKYVLWNQQMERFDFLFLFDFSPFRSLIYGMGLLRKYRSICEE